MIPSTSITFNDDDTAWVVLPDTLGIASTIALDRPCDVCGGDCEDGPPIVWHCRDCIDGRHTFDLEVECRFHGSECGHAGDLLRVSVVPGMVLPIMDGWTMPITLPPDAAPGKWAVKLTVAT